MSATRAAVASVSSQLNQKKSGYPVSAGGRPALTLWALTTMPDCCACRKIFVSRTTGSVPAPIRSRSTSPAPTEGSWSTSPTSSRCAPGGDRLDELVREDDVDHRGLVDHDQVGVQRVVRVVVGVAAGLQLQQPVDGRRLMAGQLGQALGGAAGRRGEDHLRVPWRGRARPRSGR